MMLRLGLELAYWQESDPRIKVGVLAAVLLPGRAPRLRVPVQDGQLHAEPPRPHGGRPLRLLQLLAEVGKFLQKEDLVPDKADRTSSRWRRTSC
jgi:NADH-quinone oxidoreductase subunit H